jgi:hypothetical protein
MPPSGGIFTFGVRPRKQTALLSGGIRKLTAMPQAAAAGSAEVTEPAGRASFQKCHLRVAFFCGVAVEANGFVFGRVLGGKTDLSPMLFT